GATIVWLWGRRTLDVSRHRTFSQRRRTKLQLGSHSLGKRGRFAADTVSAQLNHMLGCASMRLLVCVLTLVATTASAATVAEYEAIRAARPDGRSVPVQGLTLVRDVYRIELRSGTVHFLTAVGGETFGAVFIGDGAYHLTPATSSERRHLRLVTGDPRLETLSDRFDRLVLFFTDKTATEIAAHAAVAAGAPNEQAVRVYDEYLRRQQRDVQVNLQLRI